MRDIIVTLLVLASIPLTLYRPFFGVLTWTWLSLMNPHMLCWSFAVGQPFAQVVAITTLGSILMSKEVKRIPWNHLSIVHAIWWGWMLITTIQALNPEGAWAQWDKVWKIQLFVFVTMMMLTNKVRINALVWTMMLSLGLYGVKGGIFTLMTGGGYHVQGPARTFIGGNNEIGLALIMTIPLMRYIQLTADRVWLKNAMLVSIGLTFVAILGTQSRGAFLGLIAMTLYLIMKSRKKGLLFFGLLLFLPFAFLFMPEEWFQRMQSIQTYEEDESALGRINAWWVAWYVALDRPLWGGGFEMFRGWIFYKYAPDPEDFHDVHSIYFEALGEHGFVGLFLFLTLGVLALSTARSIVKQTQNEPRLFWMRDLASMIHVALIGYAVSGAFLGLAYFDYYYTLIATLVGVRVLLDKYHREGIPDFEVARPTGLAARLAAGRGPPVKGAAPAFRKPPVFNPKEWYLKL